MAITSPDNIRTPDPADPYQIVADMATTANDVQAALIKRGNLFVGTSALRTAFTTAPEGVHWQDTNGVMHEWVRRSGVWRMVPRIYTTSVTVSPTPNTPTSVTVNFPAGTFSSPPGIQVTPNTSASSVSLVSYTGVTTTSVNVWVLRTNASATAVSVTAVQTEP